MRSIEALDADLDVPIGECFVLPGWANLEGLNTMYLTAHFTPVLTATKKKVVRLLDAIDRGCEFAGEHAEAIQKAGELVTEVLADYLATQSDIEGLREMDAKIDAFAAGYKAKVDEAEAANRFAEVSKRKAILNSVHRVFGDLTMAIVRAPGVLEIEIRGAAYEAERARNRAIRDEEDRIREEYVRGVQQENSRLNLEARNARDLHLRRMAAAGIETDEAYTERLSRERDQKQRDQRISQ